VSFLFSRLCKKVEDKYVEIANDPLNDLSKEAKKGLSEKSTKSNDSGKDLALSLLPCLSYPLSLPF
jgi:hypothetical protein